MSTAATTTRYDLTRDEFGTLLDGEPRYRLDQVWAGLYEHLADPGDITNLPKALRARLDCLAHVLATYRLGCAGAMMALC